MHSHALYQTVGGPEQHLVELIAEEGDLSDQYIKGGVSEIHIAVDLREHQINQQIRSIHG